MSDETPTFRCLSCGEEFTRQFSAGACLDCGGRVQNLLSGEVLSVIDEAFDLDDHDEDPDRAPQASPGLATPAKKREILAMLKQGKYAKPFERGRFAAFSLIGTEDWQDYASLVLQMIQVDTLLNIEERLDRLVDVVESEQFADDTENETPPDTATQ